MRRFRGRSPPTSETPRPWFAALPFTPLVSWPTDSPLSMDSHAVHAVVHVYSVPARGWCLRGRAFGPSW